MMKRRFTGVVTVLFFLAGAVLGGIVASTWAAPEQQQPSAGTPPAPWLKGAVEERFAQVERHLRGLDQSMAEIGYRYGELLAAANTRNWEYAQYQTEKIDLSLRLAVERRPKRKESSEPFLNDSLPPVMHAVKAKNGDQLDAALENLHAGCVRCHEAEKVLYFKESVDRIKERALAVQSKSDLKPPRPQTMLIDPAELRKKLEQAGMHLLDTRPQADYAQGHIPGAAWVDVKAWQDLAKKEGGFHDAKAWGEKVGGLGIVADRPVVVYGSNLTDTARIWWTLKYLGVRDVKILDGGWQLWTKEKHPTDTAVPKIEAAKFVPKFQADRLEEIDSLKKAIGSEKVTVVDARSADEFTGKDVRGKRGGHIPGARNLEWKELLDEEGRFKSPEQLRQLFRQRGIHPEQTAVTC